MFATRAKIVSGTTNRSYASGSLPDRMFSDMGTSFRLILVAVTVSCRETDTSKNEFIAVFDAVNECA